MLSSEISVRVPPRNHPSTPKHPRFALLSDALDLPKPFGTYTLLRRLAIGGMAEVYVAKTNGIGGFEKLVAIKVIHPRFSEDEHFSQMLIEEAKISVQLNHVNIAQTFDLGRVDDTYFISMEFVDGADGYSVSKRAKKQKLPLPIHVCVHVAAEVCNGLDYAHRKRDAEGRPMGIVHRDISPQNILISHAGEVKVVDFGIAKAALRGAQTEVGVIKGKYYYMSPEQAWGDPVDQRSDTFSTAILLHELLTGEMVYQENNIPALLDKVRKADIPSPRKLRPEIPEALERAIMKALAPEPSERYASAHAFGRELTDILYQSDPTFTGARLSQLMETLFGERESQVVKVAVAAEPDRLFPSDENTLAPASREDLGVKAKESSVIFDLGAMFEDGENMTRNDILPFKSKAPPAPPSGEQTTPDRTGPTDTAPLVGSKQEWEDETFLRERSDWDESTVLDENVVNQVMGALRSEPLDDLVGESTVATANPMALLAAHEAVADLPGESTVAFQEGMPLPDRGGPMAGPSQGGVRLGPGADRYFQQAPSPLDALGGSAPPDPIPLGVKDPFERPPAIVTGAHAAQLGKPQPKRWILPILGALVVLAGFIAAGAWFAARPDPTQLEIISVPEGAAVEMDGERLSGGTPISVEDLEAEATVELRLSHPGYEERTDSFLLGEGDNRRVYLLNPIRVTLRIRSEPTDAQIYLDGVLRGNAPLEISGLSVGQELSLRATNTGTPPVEQAYTVTEEPDQLVTLSAEAP